MFIEAPFLSMLIIGLPASILSIVCYCLCCLPNETLIIDETEMPEEEDDHDQQKTTIDKKHD